MKKRRGLAAVGAGIVLALFSIWGAVGALSGSPKPAPTDMVMYDSV